MGRRGFTGDAAGFRGGDLFRGLHVARDRRARGGFAGSFAGEYDRSFSRTHLKRSLTSIDEISLCGARELGLHSRGGPVRSAIKEPASEVPAFYSAAILTKNVEVFRKVIW